MDQEYTPTAYRPSDRWVFIQINRQYQFGFELLISDFKFNPNSAQ